MKQTQKTDLEKLAKEIDGLKTKMGQYDAVFGSPDKAQEYVGLLEQYKQEQERPKSVSLVVWSSEYDRVLPAFVIANGARAMGYDVNMYFTFWGLKTLQKEGHIPKGDDFLQRGFNTILPGGAGSGKLSQYDFFGLGKKAIKHLMKKKGIADLETQIEMAYESGVNIQACTLAMEIFGMKKGIDFGGNVKSYSGVATYLLDAANADITLFI